MTILVGGVSELFQGDLDFGRRVVAQLADGQLAEATSDEVLVEDLHYGAVAIAQRLEDLRPSLLVVVGAEARGRPPGTLHRRRVVAQGLEPAQLRDIIADAVVGYVGIDLLTEVAEGLGALPPRTVAIELEPALSEMSETMSPAADRLLPTAVSMIHTEVSRGPLLELADQVRERMVGGRLGSSPLTDAVTDVLSALSVLDARGEWAGTFAHKERLRNAIAAQAASPEADHLDWAQWWGLIEEIDRLGRLEIVE